MDSEHISEGDTILLYCTEAGGYVFSQHSRLVTLFPANNPELVVWNDPVFPNVHFACFQVLPDNADTMSTSPLEIPKVQALNRDLVYGRKIKLLHVSSSKYLSLPSISEKGFLNPTATLVPVDKFDKETCVFRILPAQPEKQKGDEILPKDKVKLASVSKKEHHALFVKNSLTDRYELKMAVTDSTFAIYHQARASKINHKALRGCGVVMLFDMKREAYLAGCASMEHVPDPVKEDESINEVGARHRGSFHGIQKAPPFSGDCFWQLEKVLTPFLGDHFKMDEKCRIKHLPSQQYLAVIPGEEGQQSLIVLKKLEPGQPSDPQITFSLVSIEQAANIKENKVIAKGSYVQLRHVNSVKNLSVQGSSFVPKALSNVKVDPSSENKWFTLGIESTDGSSLHYFRIDEVNVDLVHDYYYISGVTTILSEHLKKLTEKCKQSPSSVMLQELDNLLQDLYEWIIQKRNRANMLRIAQGVDILVAYLLLNIDQSLCRKVSKVLQGYIDSANKKSQLYLAHDRFLDVLVNKVGDDIDVEQILSTLVRDESAITQKILSNSKYGEHIMSKFTVPSTLDFLSTLCFTAGKPSRHLQLLILEIIRDVGEDIFVQTEINENGQLCFSSPDEIKGPVTKYCSKNAKVEGKFKFFIAQLKLFSGVCKGVNTLAIALFCEMWDFISFEEALICIKDPEIHPLLKSAYFDYIVSAYVDLNVEESGTDIDNVWHCYQWSDICPNPIKAMNQEDNFKIVPEIDAEQMRDLQKSIREFLQKNKVLCAQEEVEGHNELMAQMFSVMEPLVSYGFYCKDEDVREIIGVMIYILNGETDKLEQSWSKILNISYHNLQQNKQYKQEGRYDKNVPGNNQIFKIKIKAIRVLHFFLKQLCNMCMMKLIYDFKYMYLNISGEDVPDDYTPINDSLRVLLQEGYHLNDQSTQIIKLARDQLRSLLAESAYECFDRTKQKGQDLIKILVDLMKYDNDELRISSALLLFDIFNEENLIFHEASISYLVTEPSKDVYGMMITFGCFSKNSDKCLLRMIQGTAISGNIGRVAVWFLNYVSEVCTLDNDETQPHYCHQMIAISSGVFNALVTYVLKYCVNDHVEQEELLNKTCQTLQRIICKNDQAQRRIFDNFVDFLDVRLAISSVAYVLTEALCDNPDLCRNLSEGDIRQIYSLATTDTNLEYCDFYSTLQTIMKPYKSPHDEPVFLKKHQECIAHMFNEHVNELMLTTTFQKRLNILQRSQDKSVELLQLLSVTDMLSTCAEGHYKYAVNICQKIFTLEELVSIISNPVVSFERKKPFSRLLTRAYLNTERDSLVSISDLCGNDLFWTHMKHCSLLITSLTTALHGINKEEVEQKLRFLFSHHMTITAWVKNTTNLNILLKSSEDDDGVPLSSFLFYLVDGIVPLLTAFCTQLRDHTSSLTTESYSSLLISQVVIVLKSINYAAAELVQTHLAVFKTTKEQMHLWNVFFEMLNFILPVNVDTTPYEGSKKHVIELMLTTSYQERLNILQKSQDDSFELLQLLSVTDMLSTCAEEQIEDAVNICQRIFTLGELVSIISDPVVSFERKKSFTRMLAQAYLNTEHDSLVFIADICRNELFWTHMEQCSLLITSLTTTLSVVDKKKQEKVKQKLRFFFSYHVTNTAWKKDPETSDLNILLKSNEDDDGVPLNSFLFYLVDGIIPLVIAFFTQLRSSNLTTESYSSLLTPQVVSVLKSINDAAAKLVHTHLAVFKTTKEQMHIWNIFFKMLNFKLPVDVETSPNEFRNSRRLIRRLNSHDYFVNHALRQYEETWRNEQELNKQFQCFVTNFKITYEGRANQRMTDDCSDITKTVGCSALKRCTRNDLNLQQLFPLFPFYNPVHNVNNILPTGASFIAMVDWFAKDSEPISDEVSTNCKLGNVSQLLILVKIIYQRLQQPITSKERADLDGLLQTTLQVTSGVVYKKIDEVNINPDLRRDKPETLMRLYMETAEPLQKALVEAQSHEQVLLHLAHPKDEIALQVLGFLDVLLYQGNRDAQKEIGRSVTSSKDVAFFKRISKLLESAVSSFGISQPKKEIAKRPSHEAPPPMDRPEILMKDPNDGLEDAGAYTVLNPIQEAVLWRSQAEMPLSPEDVDIGNFTIFSNGLNIDMTDVALTESYQRQTVRPYEVEVAGQLETSKDEAKKRASVVLEVVASMCDGQNKEMQDLFRKQDQNFANINLLVEIISLLQTLTDDLNQDIFQLIQKNIQALIEICAGNYSNQAIAFRGQVVDSVNNILRRNINFESGELTSVHISAIELLEVMLEETDTKSKELAVNISRDLDIDALMTTMKNLYDLYKTSGSTEAGKGMFRAFHVLQKIADYLGTTVNDYVKFEEKYEGTEMKTVWNHVHKFSHSIEINYVKDKKEILTRVYFQYDSSEELIEEEKQTLRKKIKRDSPEDKVNDFMEWILSIRKNKKHKRKINDKWYFQWSQVASQPRRCALIILTLLLNLFILVLFKIPREQNRDTNSTAFDDSNASFTVIIFPDIPIWFSYGLLYILGIIHFILAVWMVAEYFILEKPNIIPRSPKVVAKLLNFRNNSMHDPDKPYVKKIKEKQCFEFYLLSFAPLYRISFVIFSLLALGTSGVFYCCCIFYIFLKWRTLDLILTALRRSAIQLISVGVLGLAVLFLYAVFSFVFLHNFYDRNAGLFCNTLIECYFSVIRMGLLETLGAISLTYVGQSGPSFTVFWTRTLFDITFFIIVTTLGLNIVIAILLDRFSELRSESDNVKKDERNYCFICGIDNDTFERHQQAKGFDHHIKNDHNMWNYVYFALHLDNVHHLDHNALEKYVDVKLKRRDNCFFPLRMAKVLGGRVSHNDYGDLIKNLKAELQK